MTTVNDVLLSVTRDFGDPHQTLIETTDIVRWINQGQKEINNQLEFYTKSSTFPMLVSGDIDNMTVPVDFFKVARIVYSQPNQPDIPLVKTDIRSLDELGLDPTYDHTPQYYYIWEGKFRAYPEPTPAASTSVKVFFTANPPLVSLTTDVLTIPDAYLQNLIEYCMMRARLLDDDLQAAASINEGLTTRMARSRFDKDNEEDTFPVIRPDLHDYTF